MPNETADEVIEVENEAEIVETAEAKPGEESGPSESETRARRMGWHPKDEYEASGRDPSKWVDADTFNKRGEEELPILRDRYRKMERLYEKNEKKLDEGNRLLGDLVKHQAERERKAVEKALTTAKAERREAISNGDVARAEELSDEIAEHTAELKKPAPTVEAERNAAPEVPQEVRDWVDANPWFNSDRVMNAAATAHYGEMMGDKSMTDTQRLAKVRSEMVRRFPEKFSNQNRNRPAAVEGGNGAGRSRSNGRGWDDIPAESKALAERLIRQGAVKDKASYVKDYFGTQSAA